MERGSWVDSVWRMRGSESLVIGCVRSVDGEDLTLSIIGPVSENPAGAEMLPREGQNRRCARIPIVDLLQRWSLVEGVHASEFRGRGRLFA